VYDILAYVAWDGVRTHPCCRNLGVCIKAFYSIGGLKAGESDRGEAARSFFSLFSTGGISLGMFRFIFLCLGLWLATLFWLYLLCWQALEPYLDGLYRRSCVEYGRYRIIMTGRGISNVEVA
jgi:hypothetical protein